MTLPGSQKEKMLAGEPYFADDPVLRAAHLRAQTILSRFNATAADADEARRALLTELFARFGENTVVGAGSVVVRDLPANVLAVGNPCRVVRAL